MFGKGEVRNVEVRKGIRNRKLRNGLARNRGKGRGGEPVGTGAQRKGFNNYK